MWVKSPWKRTKLYSFLRNGNLLQEKNHTNKDAVRTFWAICSIVLVSLTRSPQRAMRISKCPPWTSPSRRRLNCEEIFCQEHQMVSGLTVLVAQLAGIILPI